MFKSKCVSFLMFMWLITVPVGADQPADTHNQSHSHDQEKTLAQEPQETCGHDEHQHKTADPALLEANRRYDAAWAKWRGEFFGVAIERGMVVADLGAGAGELTMLVADKVGPEGLVYANEIDAESLAKIRQMISRHQRQNVIPVLGTANDPLIPPQQVDLAIMVEVFHHVSDKPALLENIEQRVKPGARLVIIEADINQPGGKSGGCYSDPEVTRRQVEQAGFRFAGTRAETIEGCTFFVLTAIASQ